MKHDKTIDTIFEKKLHGHKVKAPVTAWSRIEKKLDAQAHEKSGGKWSTLIMAIVLFTSAFLLGGHSQNDYQQNGEKGSVWERPSISQERKPEVPAEHAKENDGAKVRNEGVTRENRELENTIQEQQKKIIAQDNRPKQREASSPVPAEEKDSDTMVAENTLAKGKKQDSNRWGKADKSLLQQEWQALEGKDLAPVSGQKATKTKTTSVTIVINIPDSLLQQPKLSAPAQKSSKVKQIFLELIDMTLEDKK